MTKPFRIDLTGKRYGRLTVLGYAGDRQCGKLRNKLWRVRCDCGTELVVLSGNLNCKKSGRTQSCGCRARELSSARAKTHGMYGKGVYYIWGGIIGRCLNPKSKYYTRYGGRGITVCDRWRHSFENFQADMGPRPSPKHTIERKDNDRGYSPDNCCWATMKEQASNRSNTIRVNGVTLAAMAESSGIPLSVIQERHKHGWPPESLTEPVNGRRRLTAQGEVMTMKEAARRAGIHYQTVASRIHAGWSTERALTEPPAKTGRAPR